MLQIRQYQDSDRARLVELVRENYTSLMPADGPVDATHVQAYFDHLVNIQEGDKGRLLVAEDSGQLLGFVCLLGPIAASGKEEDGEPYAFMSDLLVRETHRRQGIGALLVSKVEVLARDMGVGNLALRVAADNTVARCFYAQRDYDEKFVVMSKDIRRKPPE